MEAKPFNKMKTSDMIKVRARYDMVYSEFMKLSIDNLREVYNRIKLSSTDRHALIMATEEKLKLQTTSEVLEEQKDDNIEGEE